MTQKEKQERGKTEWSTRKQHCSALSVLRNTHTKNILKGDYVELKRALPWPPAKQWAATGQTQKTWKWSYRSDL